MTDLIATGVFTLLGVALGLFGERYLRERGKLDCQVEAWTGGAWSSRTQEFRHFEVRFYNAKEIALPVWDIHMELASDGKAPERVELYSTSTGAKVSMLNVAPSTVVSEGLKATVGGELLESLRRGRKARFVGAIPGRRGVSKDLPPW